MYRKSGCEVDVEGAVDMMDREEEEEGTSMIRRPNTAGQLVATSLEGNCPMNA